MKPAIKSLIIITVFILSSNLLFAQTYRTTLNVDVPKSISFTRIDNNLTSYYEIYLTNFSTDTLRLKEISIIDIDESSIYFKISKSELKDRYTAIGSKTKDTIMQLNPSCSGIVYIELNLQNHQLKNIAHRITFEVTNKENPEEVTIQTSESNCSLTQLVLDAPLKEGIWAAVYEPFWEQGHRRVIYTVNGRARIPGRYAIDFIQINSDGKYAKDDENLITNWLGYGVDVVAVADGIIASINDSFPESQTLSEHPKYTADRATGNYISLKIGNNKFVFYEHLQPKSIKVKVGQKVKKGDIIASLGFTGQTTGPHLHFHVADADSPLGAEGIPFVFRQFQFLGSYTNFVDFGNTSWTKTNHSEEFNRNYERPGPNAVIRFSVN